MNGNRYVIFALISMSFMAYSMQYSMVSIAIPDVIDDLNAPLRWAVWIFTIFNLAQAVSMPIIGKFSDETGRGTVFGGGMAVFAGASLVCALSPDIYTLIAARAVQGLAGGSLLPSSYGIVADKFPENRAQAIGLLSAVFPIGSIIGPNLGGVIVDNLGWRWTFALNVPVGLFIAAATLYLMPEKPGRMPGRLDYWGALFLSLAVSSFSYSLTELGQRGSDPNLLVVGGGFVIGIVATLLFLQREFRVPYPIVDLGLLAQKEFAFVNALNFLYGVSVFSIFNLIPIYLQEGYHLSPSKTGFLLTPQAAFAVIASTLASIFLPRTGYHKPIIAGLFAMCGALVILSLGLQEPQIGGFQFSNFFYLAAVISIIGVGLGIAGPAANNAAIELAPERIAAITGLRQTFRFLGNIVGVQMSAVVASRTSTIGEGLEISFLGLAIVGFLSIALVFGIPDKVGVRHPIGRQPEPSRANL